ncbi:hypothetical protein TREES_T100008847 [Tupaia chinensis]|uniref:Uncharacterized protein n=1 Tax=Tupaia chinensis TaxID=246437 RepID=L9L5A0_TUPCH|nr:hypothetical protein TREES_T100008847 [Tupaia chinensis]
MQLLWGPLSEVDFLLAVLHVSPPAKRSLEMTCMAREEAAGLPKGDQDGPFGPVDQPHAKKAAVVRGSQANTELRLHLDLRTGLPHKPEEFSLSKGPALTLLPLKESCPQAGYLWPSKEPYRKRALEAAEPNRSKTSGHLSPSGALRELLLMLSRARAPPGARAPSPTLMSALLASKLRVISCFISDIISTGIRPAPPILQTQAQILEPSVAPFLAQPPPSLPECRSAVGGCRQSSDESGMADLLIYGTMNEDSEAAISTLPDTLQPSADNRGY